MRFLLALFWTVGLEIHAFVALDPASEIVTRFSSADAPKIRSLFHPSERSIGWNASLLLITLCPRQRQIWPTQE